MSINRHKKKYFENSMEVEVKTSNDINDSNLEIRFQMDIFDYKQIVQQFFKNHRLLKSCWTNMIQDQIWANTEIKCTIAFKDNYVPANLRLNNMKCKLANGNWQFGTKFSINISPITNNSIHVTCLLTEYKKDFVHNLSVKNKLTSARKETLAEKLKYNKALNVELPWQMKFWIKIIRLNPQLFPNYLLSGKYGIKLKEHYNLIEIFLLQFMPCLKVRHLIRLFENFVLFLFSYIFGKMDRADFTTKY